MGDLKKYIDNKKTSNPDGEIFTNAQIESILAQLTLALCHSHQRKIYHRDVKLSNIFVMSDQNGEIRVKLGDFGAGRQVDHTDMNVGTNVGTQGYTAPEVYDFGKYTSKADSWSLGIVLYTLCDNGEPLLFGRPNQIKQAIDAEAYLNRIETLEDRPEQLKVYLRQLLRKKHQGGKTEVVRPTLTEFLVDP